MQGQGSPPKNPAIAAYAVTEAAVAAAAGSNVTITAGNALSPQQGYQTHQPVVSPGVASMGANLNAAGTSPVGASPINGNTYASLSPTSNNIALPKHSADDFKKLKQLGFGDEEIMASRRKLLDLVRNIDSSATLSMDVEEVLLELSAKFIEGAARFGCKLAQHRDSKTLELGDLRIYVEKILGIHVAGSGVSDSGNLEPSYYHNAVRTGNPGKLTDEHANRLKLKKKAHIVMQEDFSVAVQPSSKKTKTS